MHGTATAKGYGGYSSQCSVLPFVRALFVHTGARSVRPDNETALRGMLGDILQCFQSARHDSMLDIVEQACELAAALEGSGLVGAGVASVENHVCAGLYDLQAKQTRYTALLATGAQQPSRALLALMKDDAMAPILAGEPADDYCRRLGLVVSDRASHCVNCPASMPHGTDTIGVIAVDPAAGLLFGLTSSSRPQTANQGRVPPSCLPRIGVELWHDQHGHTAFCGICTGFTDSMLTGHCSTGDAVRHLASADLRPLPSDPPIAPQPVLNPHVDFFVLRVEGKERNGTNTPLCLLTSCALGGEAFVYSWGASENEACVLTV